MKKILIIIIGTTALLTLWYWTEENDYFNADYKDLTEDEELTFTRESNPTSIYIQHFGDKEFIFPRTPVDKIKLFKNKPFIASLTSKTLKKEFNSDIVNFFNDSTNFGWGETTWSRNESEYILRFYDKDKVVGKIYLCLNECGWIETRPFTPNVKFGQLTNGEIERIIKDEEKWD
jgi:hypothetical protein